MRTTVATAILSVAASSALVALPLTTAHAADTWIVNTKANHTQLVLGKKVTFTGTVRPKAAASGGRVTLQEKAKPGAKWVNQRSVTVNRRGAYLVKDQPKGSTTHAYRVVMAASGHHAQGISPTVKVTVYAWTSLLSQDSVNADGLTQGRVHINGKTYPDSVYQWRNSGGSIEYNVNHLCIKLQSTFGLSDDSTTGGQGEVSVQSDGAPVYSNTFDLGRTETKTLALDPAPLKLRLEAHSTSTTKGVVGYGAFGDPQVLCTQ
jgi:hypothetical protein